MSRLPLLLLLLASPALAAETVSGRATVVDGDTIDLAGRRIDLYGIDAPESAQSCEAAGGQAYRCGQSAVAALRRQIGEAVVACEPRGGDRERLTAVCKVGGTDLSAWMVSHGHALAARRVSNAYVAQEGKAWATRRGLWAGTFEEPAEWRRARTARAKTLASVPTGD